jgi:uncharacterized protein (DUF305 family)
MRFPKLILTAAVAVALTMVGATGCSSNDPESTVDPSKPYNDADVTFATDMIQHHAQALQMVDLTLGKHLDPQVAALAEEIRSAQTPQIERMVGFLNRWDKQPIPETARDHANAHGDGGPHIDGDMPGVMSVQDMKALEAAKGPDFKTKWLTMMIEHHQGAIEMAVAEKNDGEDKKATVLASDIVTSQQAQVKTMQGLLAP